MKPIWTIVISVLVAGGLAGGGTYYFINKQVTADKNNLQSQITALNTKLHTTEKLLSDAESVATTSPATSAIRANQIVATVVKSDGTLTYYYFDTLGNKLVDKTTENNKTGYMVGSGDAASIESIQFLSTDKSFFLATEDPKKAEPESPYVMSKIYQSPDKLVFGSDEKAGEVFEAWKINKAGTKIYALIPSSSQTIRDLYVINASDGVKTKLASLGGISGDVPLYLSSDETKVLAVGSKERLEDNYHYQDMYAETVNLSTKQVAETLLWRDNRTTEWISPEGFSVGPKLLKAVTHYKEGDTYGVRSVDIATGASEDIYKINGIGQASDLTWSSDGMKLAFGISEYGDKSNLPLDQGIAMYNYGTKKSTQLLKTNIVRDGSLETNRASVIFGTFSDKGLAYSVLNSSTDQSLYYLDIPTLKSYQLDKALTNVSLFSGYIF